MPRYRLTLEYDGGPYRGFQAQGDLPTVQASIERAVKAFSGETLRLQAAGRTDTGVHATGQVIHIDLEKAWKPDVVRDAINAHLAPEPIAVLDAAEAPEGWHARFSATRRRLRMR
jgi:tRNA pseudouridine38-40 synthase